MVLKLLACKVLAREAGFLSAGCKNTIDITYLRQGYHNEPDRLRAILQEQIDRIDAKDDPYTCAEEIAPVDAIILGYGLCSGGVSGLKSKRLPIIVPRAHDCITLFLGSKERYRELFDAGSGGIYWYTPGWIENSVMPSKFRYELSLKRNTELYGEDNAEYLAEMENGWMREYKNLSYVEIEGIPYPDTYMPYVNECADYLGWELNTYKGDISLLKRLLDGEWNEEDFLIVPPGETIAQSYDEKILTAVTGG